MRGGGSSSSLSSALAPAAAELVGRIDHQHLVATARGGLVQGIVSHADLLDQDLARKLAGLRVGDALEHAQIGMRPVRHHAEHRMSRIGRGGRMVGACQQPTREAIGERRLADTGRTAQQPSVRQSARVERANEHRLRSGVSEQERVGVRCDHSVRRPNRSDTVCPDRGRDLGLGPVGVDHREPLGLPVGEQTEPGAHALVVADALGLEAVGSAAGGTAGEAGGDRQIEDERQIGAMRPEQRRLQGVDQIEPQLTRDALVDAAGIGEPVGEHPASRPQGRQDRAVQVVLPRGEEQVELGQWSPAFGRPIDDQGADRLGPLRAAGLAGLHRVEPPLAQALGEVPELGALARPLPALDGDEAADLHAVGIRSRAGPRSDS